MNIDDGALQLQRVPLLASLAPADLRRVASLVSERRVARGEMICPEGGAGHEMYLVVEGEASVDQAGRRVGALAPGDAFGELSLLDRGPRSASVTAETDMVLLVLGESDLTSLLDEVPALAHRLLAHLATRIRQLQAQLAST